MLRFIKKVIPQKFKFHIKKFLTYKRYKEIKVCFKKNKDVKIIFIGTPEYGNLGDQAICIAILHILKKINANKSIIEIPASLYWDYAKEICDLVSSKDIICTIGGGNLGNLYISEENMRKDIISRFLENKIVIMPQSIYFSKDDEGKKALEQSRKIYCKHKNLHLITRDQASFLFAKNNFKKINHYLLPDIVTALEGELALKNAIRKGVIFFLRKDKEKILTDTNIEHIVSILKGKNIDYEMNDTTVPYGVNKKNRMNEVMLKINKAYASRLVITDRFHGLIFAVITHTPVIVFKSFDTKISEGIKWFKNLEYVHYLEGDEDKIENIMLTYLEDDSINTNCSSGCKETLLRELESIFLEDKRES